MVDLTDDDLESSSPPTPTLKKTRITKAKIQARQQQESTTLHNSRGNPTPNPFQRHTISWKPSETILYNPTILPWNTFIQTQVSQPSPGRQTTILHIFPLPPYLPLCKPRLARAYPTSLSTSSHYFNPSPPRYLILLPNQTLFSCFRYKHHKLWKHLTWQLTTNNTTN